MARIRSAVATCSSSLAFTARVIDAVREAQARGASDHDVDHAGAHDPADALAGAFAESAAASPAAAARLIEAWSPEPHEV